MKLFNRFFRRVDVNLQNNKSSIRKITKVGNSYCITIPPTVIEALMKNSNTEYVELSVKPILDDDYILIKPHKKIS